MRAIQAVTKIAPQWGLYFETQLFNIAGEFCTAYSGGLWTSKLIPPGVWIALPPIQGKFQLINAENYYEGEVNALTAGAAITCIALNYTLAAAYSKLGENDTTRALSELWEKITDACGNIDDPTFDKATFYRIIN